MTMPPETPIPRAVDSTPMDAFVTRKKLKHAREIAQEGSVSIPTADFVPAIQAEVGSSVAVRAYSYRILVPLAHVIRESPRSFRRLEIASDEDILLLQAMFIRHFGGVTVSVSGRAPIRGIGARDPNNPLETQEEKSIQLSRFTQRRFTSRINTSALSAVNWKKPSARVLS